MALLRAEDLHVAAGQTEILRGVSLTLDRGQTLGIVGESGCGKSMLASTLMAMLPTGCRLTKGSIQLNGLELTTQSERHLLEMRGRDLALVMQDPFTSLNPVMRIGDQIAESLVLHQSASWGSARRSAVELMERVGIPDPVGSAQRFPHQLSGGQRQRIVIAIAFACKPKLLIADEPTTALDVTLQAQVLHLIQELQREEGTAVILISHNIGVIAAVSDVVAVFYAGKVVEQGPTKTLLGDPEHPYTQALLDALPRVGVERLRTIREQPPRFGDLGAGCAFMPRCDVANERCNQDPPLQQILPGHCVRCWRAIEAAERANPSAVHQSPVSG